jgi:hypothetical protein
MFGVAFCSGETTENFSDVFSLLKESLFAIFGFNYCPDFLLADGAASITSAARNVFNITYDRGAMCSVHVRANVKKTYKGSKAVFQKIQFDFDYIQAATTRREFDHLINAFKRKWIHWARGSAGTPEATNMSGFLEYLENQWVVILGGWFEGMIMGFPSSNNNLEATNLHFKDNNFPSPKCSLNSCLNNLKNGVEFYSNAYRDGTKRWHSSVLNNNSLGKKTYSWLALQAKAVQYISSFEGDFTH